MPFYYSRYKKSYEFYFGDRFNLSIEIEYFGNGISDGKFLDTSEVRRNCAPFSHIHGGLRHEFNEWTIS